MSWKHMCVWWYFMVSFLSLKTKRMKKHCIGLWKNKIMDCEWFCKCIPAHLINMCNDQRLSARDHTQWAILHHTIYTSVLCRGGGTLFITKLKVLFFNFPFLLFFCLEALLKVFHSNHSITSLCLRFSPFPFQQKATWVHEHIKINTVIGI